MRSVRAFWRGVRQGFGFPVAALDVSPKGQVARLVERMPMRSRLGECDGCDAPEGEWCKMGCTYLDPMDYR